MRCSAGLSGFHGDHLAVGRRNGHRPGRNVTLRIAEKIQTEGRQNPQRGPEPRPGQPGDDPAAGRQRQRIINAVSYDHQPPFSHAARHEAPVRRAPIVPQSPSRSRSRDLKERCQTGSLYRSLTVAGLKGGDR